MKVRTAIIPAAGLGTRFLPATKTLPKEMFPIVDTPAIQLVVEEAIASGIESIMIITNGHKRAIEDYFDQSFELQTLLGRRGKPELEELVRDISNMVEIHYTRQKEPLGLGHAVLCARQFVGDEPFAVLLPDDLIQSQIPCLKQLLNMYDRFGTSILATDLVDFDEVDKYGIVGLHEEHEHLDAGMHFVKQIIEKPTPDDAPSNQAIIGRYVLEPQVFDILASLGSGKNGEIQLTDALAILNQRSPMMAYRIRGKRYDVGDKLGYLQACVEFALQRDGLRSEFLPFLDALVARWKPLMNMNAPVVS